MTAKVISLRRLRRQQARSTARAKAGVTAAAHGERRDLAAARRAEAERAELSVEDAAAMLDALPAEEYESVYNERMAI